MGKPPPPADKAARKSEVQISTRPEIDSPPPSITFGDWVLKCQKSGGAQNCSLHQRLADSKNRQIIAFKAASHAAAPYLEISAPLGLSIPYGVALVLPDKTEFPMQLADCERTGCRAVVPLEEATLNKLKYAGKLGVRFQDSKSGKVVTINGSLKGFTQGIAVLLRAG